MRTVWVSPEGQPSPGGQPGTQTLPPIPQQAEERSSQAAGCGGLRDKRDSDLGADQLQEATVTLKWKSNRGGGVPRAQEPGLPSEHWEGRKAGGVRCRGGSVCSAHPCPLETVPPLFHDV